MDSLIKLKTEKLNKLLIKQTMYQQSGYEIPDYIVNEIKTLKEDLKNVVGKDGGRTSTLPTGQ